MDSRSLAKADDSKKDHRPCSEEQGNFSMLKFIAAHHRGKFIAGCPIYKHS